METVTLTQLEQRILSHIREYIGTHGISPTIAEVAEALDIRSRGTVHRYVHSLISKGQLVRLGTGWRGLRVAEDAFNDSQKPVSERPANTTQRSGAQRSQGINGKDSASVELADPAVSGTLGLSANAAKASHPPGLQSPDLASLTLPLLGKIAAGMPIEAIPDETHLDLAAFFIGPDRYALRVSGESMIDAGILDGDTVIIRKQSRAQPGDIVVALIDAQEATLKRLGEYSSQVVELIAENQLIPKMRYSASRVAIQGVLIGQLRSY